MIARVPARATLAGSPLPDISAATGPSTDLDHDCKIDGDDLESLLGAWTSTLRGARDELLPDSVRRDALTLVAA